jgi:hypothetical protein
MTLAALDQIRAHLTDVETTTNDFVAALQTLPPRIAAALVAEIAQRFDAAYTPRAHPQLSRNGHSHHPPRRLAPVGPNAGPSEIIQRILTRRPHGLTLRGILTAAEGAYTSKSPYPERVLANQIRIFLRDGRLTEDAGGKIQLSPTFRFRHVPPRLTPADTSSRADLPGSAQIVRDIVARHPGGITRNHILELSAGRFRSKSARPHLVLRTQIAEYLRVGILTQRDGLLFLAEDAPAEAPAAEPPALQKITTFIHDFLTQHPDGATSSEIVAASEGRIKTRAMNPAQTIYSQIAAWLKKKTLKRDAAGKLSLRSAPTDGRTTRHPDGAGDAIRALLAAQNGKPVKSHDIVAKLLPKITTKAKRPDKVIRNALERLKQRGIIQIRNGEYQMVTHP